MNCIQSRILREVGLTVLGLKLSQGKTASLILPSVRSPPLRVDKTVPSTAM